MATNRQARRGFAPRLIRQQKGQVLIEALVALAILGIVAVAFLTALTTSSVVIILADEKTTAESLTRTELEFIKNSPYQPGGFTYELPSSPPGWDPGHALPSGHSNYSLDVIGVPIDPTTHLPLGDDLGMQEITVKVYHQDKPAPVLTTSTQKIR